MAAFLPIALGAASLAGGLLSARRKAPPKPQQIDISNELAMISELYNQARTQQQELGSRQLAQGLTQTSESLAGRGIYRSPVSERAMGQTRKTYAMALSDALARLSAEEMAKRAELSAGARQFNANAVNQYNQQKYAQTMANRAALAGGLSSLGAGLLMRGFAPTATPTAVPTEQMNTYSLENSPFTAQSELARRLSETGMRF